MTLFKPEKQGSQKVRKIEEHSETRDSLLMERPNTTDSTHFLAWETSWRDTNRELANLTHIHSVALYIWSSKVDGLLYDFPDRVSKLIHNISACENFSAAIRTIDKKAGRLESKEMNEYLTCLEEAIKVLLKRKETELKDVLKQSVVSVP